MANAVINKAEFTVIDRDSLVDSSLLTHPLYGEFARNSVDRYHELELAVSISGCWRSCCSPRGWLIERASLTTFQSSAVRPSVMRPGFSVAWNKIILCITSRLAYGSQSRIMFGYSA